MTFFLLWKSEKESRAKFYDCRECLQKGLIENRVCYRYDDTAEIQVPRVAEDGRLERKREPKILDRLEFLNLLEELYSEMGSPTSMFLFQQELFPKVCIMGLVIQARDEMDLIGLESKCSKYKVPPVPGSVIEWPNRLSQAFDLITESRNEFELYRLEQVKSESSKGVR